MYSLIDFIEARHQDIDLSMEQTYDLWGSKKSFTRRMNAPHRCSFLDVVRLAVRIKVSPEELTTTYRMGAESLSQEDAKLLNHFNSIPEPV